MQMSYNHWGPQRQRQTIRKTAGRVMMVVMMRRRMTGAWEMTIGVTLKTMMTKLNLACSA